MAKVQTSHVSEADTPLGPTAQPLKQFAEFLQPYIEVIRFKKVRSSICASLIPVLMPPSLKGPCLSSGPTVCQALHVSGLEDPHEAAHPVWGLTLSACRDGLPLRSYYAYFFKFLLCAFLVRSSACTINDIFDRDIDRLVGPYRLFDP